MSQLLSLLPPLTLKSSNDHRGHGDSAAAAAKAVTGAFAADFGRWAVLATDGAYRPMVHLGLDDWKSVAARDSRQLQELLNHLERWEADDDPDGIHLQRAKRHDDKAIAVISF